MDSYSARTQPPVKSSSGPWLLLLVLLLAGGAVIYLGWEALERAQLAAENAVTGRDQLQGKLHEAEKAVSDAKSQANEASTALEEANGKIKALEDNLEQTEAALAKVKSTADSLSDKLKGEIARGDIKLSQRGDRIQVDLIDKILFDSGEAKLSTRGQEVLGRVATVLKTIEDKQVQVSGHTDNSPITNEELKKEFATNWELSVARAVNVVRYLSETGGVPPKNLLAAGYSQYRPVAGNATPKGRAANRRIEILLTPVVVAAKKR